VRDARDARDSNYRTELLVEEARPESVLDGLQSVMNSSLPGNMLLCPKCAGVMHSYERNGVHLEQCDKCRGIFLDFGELEALTQLESRFVAAPPPPPPAHQPHPQQAYGPVWGSHRGHRYRKGGFGRLFFSS
jgi:Zn-finger nucleic acid-binding protein